MFKESVGDKYKIRFTHLTTLVNTFGAMMSSGHLVKLTSRNKSGQDQVNVVRQACVLGIIEGCFIYTR